MFPYLLFLSSIHLFTAGLSNAEDVIKCLKMPKEKIRISCPKGHVIYNPEILAASSKGGSCDPSPLDCFGFHKRLERQTKACFWRKSCAIDLRSDYKIPSCSDQTTTEKVSYIVIKQTYCIPKGLIIDICKKPPKGFNFQMGVIRSHKGYPKRKPRPMACSMDIPIGKSRTLMLEIKPDGNSFPLGLTLQDVKSGGLNCMNLIHNDEIIVNGSESEAVRVIAEYRWNRKQLSGFIIPFVAYKTRTLEAFLGWPNRSRPVMRELGWIREVRPVIEQCAVNVDGLMRLVCNDDEVIYSPAVSFSGYTRRDSKCIFSDRYPCGGFTPELLVQRNVCYWKSSCDITWNGADRIVVSKVQKCIGYSVSSIGLSGHRCIQKGNIEDLCTNSTVVINTSWGIIRSHPLYPWYFDSSFPECKRIIHIGQRHALLLIVQDMNLDPDGRDKFSVQHSRKNIKKEVMNAKTGQEGAQLIVRGGNLVIKFKPFKSSKAGRGFVLVFRRFHVSRHELPLTRSFHPEKSKTDLMTLSDAASTSVTFSLSNWRLCSESSQLRKRAHACNSRVWTDYFTRLE